MRLESQNAAVVHSTFMVAYEKMSMKWAKVTLVQCGCVVLVLVLICKNLALHDMQSRTKSDSWFSTVQTLQTLFATLSLYTTLG